MTQAHSTLGASSAYRWMTCPGSVRESAGLPNVSSEYAKEGTAAHSLAECCLKRGFDADKYIGDKVEADGSEYLVDEDMAAAVQVYLDAVRDDKHGYDGKLIVEHRFDLSSLHPAFFGTNDACVYRDGILYVHDYKHGRGVSVEVTDNPQLKYYALGALRTAFKKPVEAVELVITQPRCPHPDGPVRRWRTTVVDLLDFEADLIEAAARTEDPEAPLLAGNHCKFCLAAPKCPALRDSVYDAAKADFGANSGDLVLSEPSTFDGPALAEVLRHAEMIKDWLRRVQEYAHHEAESGRAPPGFKLVNNRATRKFVGDDADIVNFLSGDLAMESEHMYSEPKLRSPAQIEAALKAHYGFRGKKAGEAIADMVQSVSSGTVLAPESDPRPAAQSEATTEFA